MINDTVTGSWDVDFEETVRGHLPFLDRNEALRPSTSLRDYGLDSVSTIGLLAALESRYDVVFRDDALDLKNFQTPAVLWATLQSVR